MRAERPAESPPQRDPLTLPAGQRRFDRRGVLEVMRTLGVTEPVVVKFGKLARSKSGF
jgi:hypothetical protein